MSVVVWSTARTNTAPSFRDHIASTRLTFFVLDGTLLADPTDPVAPSHVRARQKMERK